MRRTLKFKASRPTGMDRNNSPRGATNLRMFFIAFRSPFGSSGSPYIPSPSCSKEDMLIAQSNTRGLRSSSATVIACTRELLEMIGLYSIVVGRAPKRIHVASYHGEIDPMTATDFPMIGYRPSAAKAAYRYRDRLTSRRA